MTVTRYVTRRYKCHSCGNEWKSNVVESASPIENCPKGCNTDTKIVYRGSYGDVRQNGLKAADIAYKMAEQDYGMSNMRDNQREGDIAAILPASNPVEQTIQKQGGFYSGGRESSIGMASAAKMERLAMGIPDPVASVQNSMKRTPSIIDSTRRNPIARG